MMVLRPWASAWADHAARLDVIAEAGRLDVDMVLRGPVDPRLVVHAVAAFS
ncbi:MAG: hypothetical protein HYU41_08875 [Candidatus Rokubacteria bacterium]|nr:hypothetical protein [Candidatus Rokubacteria bacterium]